MDSCQRFKEMISDYIEGGLDQQNKLQMEKHLSDCLRCKQVVRQLKGLIRNIRELPTINVSPDFETILRARISMESSLARHRIGRLFPSGQFRLPAYAFSAVVIIVVMFAVFSQIMRSNLSYKPEAKVNEALIDQRTLQFNRSSNDSVLYIIEREPFHGMRSQNPGTSGRYDPLHSKINPDSVHVTRDPKLYFEKIQAYESKVFY